MKKLTSLILILSFVLTAFSQENSLLWEITKRGHKTSYLFGSVHSSNDAVIAFGNGTLPYLFKCKAYAGEIIVDPNDMFAILPFLFEKDSSKQCGNLLNPEELALVKNIVGEKLGEEMNILLPAMSPYMIAALISMPVDEQQNEANTYFLDVYLQEKADSLGKDLISLESVKSQMSYIQKIDGQIQKTYLLEVVENQDSVGIEFDELIEIYLAQDLTRIKELLLEAADEDPLFTDGFMEERNLLQAEGIMKTMKSQSVFTAIGAAHLPGEDGVIQILLDAGFKLTPITLN